MACYLRLVCLALTIHEILEDSYHESLATFKAKTTEIWS